MKIEAVTVCINYADFLNAVAPFNIPLLDRWIIITESTDYPTRHICAKYGLQCLLSNDHTLDGHSFNKGRLIERGLQHLAAGEWRLHLDADIVLPNRFRKILDRASLNRDCIYGADRIMVRNYEHWQNLIKSGWLHGQTRGPHTIDTPSGYTLGHRWANHDTGYAPIGFFQLWADDEYNTARIKPYPQHHGSACRTDVQHALQWDRMNRILIPEIIVAHLESEKAVNGINWKGRKTKQFGPDFGFIKGSAS